MSRCNCVVWSLALYLRRLRRGDRSCAISWRLSHHGRWPHAFVTTGTGHRVGYGPTEEYASSVVAMRWYNPLRWLRKAWFSGRVYWGRDA